MLHHESCKKNQWLVCLMGIGLALSAWLTGAYLRAGYAGSIVLAAASVWALWTLMHKAVRGKELLVLLGFAAVIGIVLILGVHIDVDAMDLYGGTIHKNKITPYSWKDLCALFGMLPALNAIFCALYRKIADAKAADAQTFDAERHIKRQLVIFGVLFALWLPYLLAYWPGMILSDTLSSLRQALGLTRLNNRHPFCYTIFIRICIIIGQKLFGSNTAGYALYTVLQMLYLSFCLGYLLNWVWRHGRFGRFVAIVFTVLFGVLPYFAAFSIAGWKDPVFSVSVAALSVYLLNEVLYEKNKPSLPALAGYVILLMVTVFARHNGIGILAVVAVWQLLSLLVRRKLTFRPKVQTAVITAAVIALYLVITGPVYDYLDIRSDKREANALVVQQMARVAAMNGEMNEAERDYLNALLPMERYESTYRPCCVDMLKWDGYFNGDVLSEDLYSRWFTLMLKNPRFYFEAWELNTFGFWTLNLPDINSKASNISGGQLQNTRESGIETLNGMGIETANLLKDERARALLPVDSWFVPIGWMIWILAFLFICLCLKGQGRLLYGLLPSIGLAVPLVIGTPISYWMRYIVALHYLLPVFILLFGMKGNEKTESKLFLETADEE